jgi:hypothetical protein
MSSVAPPHHQREANPADRPFFDPKTHLRRQLQRHVIKPPRFCSYDSTAPEPWMARALGGNHNPAILADSAAMESVHMPLVTAHKPRRMQVRLLVQG